MTDDLIPVEVGEDTVNLRPRLGLAAGIAIQRLVVEANQSDKPATAAELTGLLAEAYLLHGVASWSFPEPVTPDNIRKRLLDDFERGAPVADVADGLYMAAVIAPLLKRALTSSPSTSSNGSTSAHGSGAQSRPKRSKRSSTSTSLMDDTETTT